MTNIISNILQPSQVAKIRDRPVRSNSVAIVPLITIHKRFPLTLPICVGDLTHTPDFFSWMSKSGWALV